MALRPRLVLPLLAVAAALVVAGCSEKESGIGAGQEPTAKTEKREKAPAAAPSAPEVQGEAVAKATGTPKIVSPKGTPPTTLQKRDLKVGKGAPIRAGQQVLVNYVGALYGSGKQFDSSFASGQPIPVQLGAGGVIPGFEQGLQGMRVGGRRQVIIPPDLGYGAQGSPPSIPGNSTLIFVLDVVSAQ